MTKPSKPLARPVLPRPLPQPPPRLVPAVAAATATFVVATHDLSRGAGSASDTSLSWSRVATNSAIFLIVAFTVVAVSISVRQHVRRERANPMITTYIVLAAFVLLGYGAWEAFSTPALVAPASSLPGAAGKLLQSR